MARHSGQSASMPCPHPSPIARCLLCCSWAGGKLSEYWDSGGLGFILSVGECDGNRLGAADKQARHAITIQDKMGVGHSKLRLSMQ
jgi:hypothetical protein